MSVRVKGSGDTRRILILWGISLAVFLLTVLFLFPRAADFTILVSTHNYLGYAESLITNGEYRKAAELLEAMVAYQKPQESDSYFLLAEAYEEYGNAMLAAYWRSRGEFLKAWWSVPVPKSPEEVGNAWEKTLQWARQASSALRQDERFLDPDLTRPLLKSLTLRWAYSGIALTRWIRGATPADILALLVASGDFLGVPDGRIGDTGITSPVQIQIESIGGRHRMNTRILVDNKPIVDVSQFNPGLYAVVIDPTDGSVEDVWSFNTVARPASIQEFLEAVNNAPDGRIVALAIAIDIGAKLNRWSIEDALARIGIALPSYRFITTNIRQNYPFAAVGVTGAKKGTGLMVYGEMDRSRAFIVVMPSSS